MYPILRKQVLSDFVKLLVVRAPLVARKARPGQFVIVRIDEKGERIPLTIADLDAQEGTNTLIFQEVGKSTMQMGLLEVGDSFENVAGPLDHPTEIDNAFERDPEHTASRIRIPPFQSDAEWLPSGAVTLPWMLPELLAMGQAKIAVKAIHDYLQTSQW